MTDNLRPNNRTTCNRVNTQNEWTFQMHDDVRLWDCMRFQFFMNREKRKEHFRNYNLLATIWLIRTMNEHCFIISAVIHMIKFMLWICRKRFICINKVHHLHLTLLECNFCFGSILLYAAASRESKETQREQHTKRWLLQRQRKETICTLFIDNAMHILTNWWCFINAFEWKCSTELLHFHYVKLALKLCKCNIASLSFRLKIELSVQICAHKINYVILFDYKFRSFIVHLVTNFLANPIEIKRMPSVSLASNWHSNSWII